MELLFILAYQVVSNTHSFLTHIPCDLFAQAGRLKAIFLCFFEECQLISHSSCHKNEICCLKVEVDFPGPRPARAGPLFSIFTQAESSYRPLLYSGWRCWDRQSPSLFLLKPAVPPFRQNWTWKVFPMIQNKEGHFAIQLSFSGYLRPPGALPLPQAALKLRQDFPK